MSLSLEAMVRLFRDGWLAERKALQVLFDESDELVKVDLSVSVNIVLRKEHIKIAR